MGKKMRYECIDAGSEYCPCYLAETGDCITCSHLQGKSFCDCNWRGVCIYQEYYWNGKKAKSARESYKAKILDKVLIGDNLLIFKISVMKTLARQLKQPGSYIFIRNINKPQYYDIPMSIMYSNEHIGEIHVAVQILGTKTKSLLNLKDEIYVRGPYWNGLLGLKELKTLKNVNTLIIARGVALAPSVLVANYLNKNNNKVTMLVDKGKVDSIFIENYIKDLDIITIESDITTEKGRLLIEELVKNNYYSLCYSGGSDRQHSEIEKILSKVAPNTKLIISNNKEICCGEGICGACSVKVGKKTIKACKTQFDATHMVEKGEK